MDDIIQQASTVLLLEEMRNYIDEGHENEHVAEPSHRRSRREDGESGSEYIYRLLTEEDTCREQLRLDRYMLSNLVQLMIERNLLVDGRFITVTEQVVIFLYIMAKGASYRDVKDRFKHSISTISYYFKLVLDALVTLSPDIIRPHRNLHEVPPEVENSDLYSPFFKDARGALDGKHIQAVVNDEQGGAFRSRKGSKTWNVLACCSFDRLFTYISVGWQGSAHDITVWKDSLMNSKYCFPHPPEGKYYLVDSGYPNTLGYLAPFADDYVRSHVPEYKPAPPEGLKECFNYRHSSLRMKVEQSFGHVKKRFKILYNMPQMSQRYQMSIIIAAFTLHNYIGMQKLGIPVMQHPPSQGTVDTTMNDKARKTKMNEIRMNIATEIMQFCGEDGAEDEMDEEI